MKQRNYENNVASGSPKRGRHFVSSCHSACELRANLYLKWCLQVKTEAYQHVSRLNESCSEMYIPELSFIKPRHERRRQTRTASRFNKRTFGCWQEAISEALLGGSYSTSRPPQITLNFKPVLLQKARPTTTSAGVIWHWHEQLHFAVTSTPSAADRDDGIIRRAEQEDTLEKQEAGDHAILNFTHSRKDTSCSFTQPSSLWATLIWYLVLALLSFPLSRTTCTDT